MTKEDIHYDAYSLRSKVRFLFKAVISNLGPLSPEVLRVQ